MSPETKTTLSTLRARSEDFLNHAQATGERLHMRSSGYAAAETIGGLLIEKQPGFFILTAECDVAGKGLVSHVVYNTREQCTPVVFESTESDEGWGRQVPRGDYDIVAARLLELLPEAS